MHTSIAFIDTNGVQQMRRDARLVTPTGHVTGHGALTLWLLEAKHNRYFEYPYHFSETDLAEGVCQRILARVGL